MPKKPEMRLPRLPTEKEEMPGPEMRGYIYQEILLNPEKWEFETMIYCLIDNQPIWIDRCGLAKIKLPRTCPNYPEDIDATLEMMQELWDVRPDLCDKTVDYLDDHGGVRGLILNGPEWAANLICKTLVGQAKKMVLTPKKKRKSSFVE